MVRWFTRRDGRIILGRTEHDNRNDSCAGDSGYPEHLFGEGGPSRESVGFQI